MLTRRAHSLFPAATFVLIVVSYGFMTSPNGRPPTRATRRANVEDFTSVSYNEDGVRVGRIRQSQGFLSAYCGHLTRLYNQLGQLLMSSHSPGEVAAIKSELDGLFARYAAKARELHQIITDVEERNRAALDYQSELDLKKRVDED